MYKPVLKAAVMERNAAKLHLEEFPSEVKREYTNMDFVNEHRDFSKITESDLEALFAVLKKRCPESWTCEFAKRGRELHKKFMTLKRGSTRKFIDPDRKDLEHKDEESKVEHLMTVPACWSMSTKERALELRQILRHFTMFAPFEGRPFVRAWLEAILPCFLRWILLSNSNDELLIKTLKNFLGAFGQEGIVVCLSDKGASMLKSLKNAARSVEAMGRGTVERYYWKHLAISSCEEEEVEWRQLATLNNEPLQVSQLDYLPHDWLLDSNDWGQIFANIVSPEISDCFEKKIKDIFGEKELWDIQHGPPKTLARTLAKGYEYKFEFSSQKSLPRRWLGFREKFREVFKRDPKNSRDFIWNIVDFARVSITVPGAAEVLEAKRLIQEHFKVVSLKNGYNSKVQVKGSGYRDLKLLIEVEFDDLRLGGVARVQPKTTLICEVQILCQAWLNNKKTTSISYKIQRAQTLSDLFYDAAKYAKIKGTESRALNIDATSIIKNGWINFARVADFSNISPDKLLLTAANEGWNVSGVNLLVEQLKANREVCDAKGLTYAESLTPLMLASKNGSVGITNLLIELGCNIKSNTIYGKTALTFAVRNGHEGCVRSLVAAGACVEETNHGGKCALDFALDNLHLEATNKNRRVVKLLKGEAVISSSESGVDRQKTKFDEIEKAAIEGRLSRFFDVEEVPQSLVSELLNTKTTVASLENLLQTLWFGGKVGHKMKASFLTPLHHAAKYGTVDTLTVLLNAGSSMDARTIQGFSPLTYAISSNKLNNVKLLLKAKAKVNVKDNEGVTPIIFAARWATGMIVAELLKFGASLDDTTNLGYSPYDLVRRNKIYGPNVLKVLDEYRQKQWK